MHEFRSREKRDDSGHDREGPAADLDNSCQERQPDGGGEQTVVEFGTLARYSPGAHLLSSPSPPKRRFRRPYSARAMSISSRPKSGQ